MTAFVGPATGETVWYLTDTVSKPLFADLLDAFAHAVGAGPQKRVVLLLDNAGWHTLPNLAVPDGLKLVYLPRLLPRTAPCGAFPNLLRRSWAQASSARRDALDAGGRTRRQHLRPQPGQAHPHLTERCSNLSTRQPEISSRTNFAWWPKNQAPL